MQEPLLGKEPRIGIISPYKAQVNALKAKLQELMPTTAEFIDVNTIDGFQGREKDVIIFSTVRTSVSKNKRIGFVADERRINVGLTRAKCSLIVVGNRNVLQHDTNWEALLSCTSEQGCVTLSPWGLRLHAWDSCMGPCTAVNTRSIAQKRYALLATVS